MTPGGRIRTVAGMDRSVAVQQLPVLHAVAIRLRDDGLDDHVIAVALGIDEDQVPVSLRVAQRKLDRLLTMDDVPGGRIDRVGGTHDNQSPERGATPGDSKSC